MVKALFPIGKTQWAKWDDAQREAFNEARDAGVPYADAVAAASQTRAPKKKSVFDIIDDVVETVSDVVEVAAMVTPVAKVVRATTKRAPKKDK